MLEITCNESEVFTIGDNIRITVKRIKGQQTHLAIIAPRNVSVDREEVYLRKQKEKNGNS